MHDFKTQQIITKKRSLFIVLLLTACSPSGSQKTDQNTSIAYESEQPLKSVSQENFGYEDVEEMENMQALSQAAFRKYPFIAIVKDISITYPEWPFGDPVDTDGFISGVRQYKVKLITSLRGDLREKFKYEIYSEAGNFALNEAPYPLAFCYSERTKSYVAREVEGQMFDDPRFIALFKAEWKKKKSVNFSEKPCFLDVQPK